MKPILFTALILSLLTPAMAQDWKIHSVDNEGKGADGARLLDVNGDGRLDIASGWEEAGETRIYLHPGKDSVKNAWPKVTVGQVPTAEDAVFCDLDGDGKFDVVSASETGRALYIHWAPQDQKDYLNKDSWKTEVLTESKDLHRWMYTVPLQIDGKHGIDLLAVGKKEKIVWFESPENPRDVTQWKMHVISEQGGWTMGLAGVDMDGDGDKDALVGVRKTNPGVKWLENPGHGPDQQKTWAVHPVGPQGIATGFLAVTDLDKDGFQDVLSPSMEEKNIVIYRGLDKKGKKWDIIKIEVPKHRNKGIAVGDVDLDGQDDLVITHELGDAVWLSHDGEIGAKHWAYNYIADGGKLDDVTLYDVDSDGDLDVFTTDERGQQVLWYENPTK